MADRWCTKACRLSETCVEGCKLIFNSRVLVIRIIAWIFPETKLVEIILYLSHTTCYNIDLWSSKMFENFSSSFNHSAFNFGKNNKLNQLDTATDYWFAIEDYVFWNSPYKFMRYQDFFRWKCLAWCINKHARFCARVCFHSIISVSLKIVQPIFNALHNRFALFGFKSFLPFSFYFVKCQ